MIFRFVRWFVCGMIVIVTALPVRATQYLPFGDTVIACGMEFDNINPASISCPGASANISSTFGLLPEPTVTVTATATATNKGDFSKATSTGVFKYFFEVVGPPAQAVLVNLNLPGEICPTDESVGVNGFLAECIGASITSPGFYFGLGSPMPPLMSGETDPALPVPALWLVPNLVNEIDIAAGVWAQVGGLGFPVTVGDTFSYSLLPTVDTAGYQIVILPEPASLALVAVGLFAFGVIACRKSSDRGALGAAQ